MISAFGVDHGEVSKGLVDSARRIVQPSKKSAKMVYGYNQKGAGKAYAPSRDRAVTKKPWTLEEKKAFYSRKNKYIRTGALP